MKYHARLTGCVLIIALSMSSQASGAELMGASNLLEKISKAVLSTNAAPQDADAIAREKLKSDVSAFNEQKKTLSPEQASSARLALIDRFWGLDPSAQNRGRRWNDQHPLSLTRIIEVIPGPASWKSLSELVEKRQANGALEGRRNAVLRMMCLLLTSQPAKMKDELDKLAKANTGKDQGQEEWTKNELQSLYAIVDNLSRSADPATVVKKFEESLGRLKNIGAKSTVTITIPDLVLLAGEEKASALVERVLAVPKIRIESVTGRETMRIVRNVALANIAKLERPLWRLTCSLESTELFEAFDKKFPDPGTNKQDNAEDDLSGTEFVRESSYDSDRYMDQYEKATALAYYIFGLVIEGRTNEAASRLLSMQDKELEGYSFESVSHEVDMRTCRTGLFDTYMAVLKEKPESKLLSKAIPLSVAVNRTAEIIKLLEDAIAKKDTSFSKRVSYMDRLAVTYLAGDDTEKAVSEIRSILKENADKELPDTQSEFADIKRRSASLLATLGSLTSHTNLLDEGIAALNSIAARDPESSMMGTDLFEALIDNGRYAEAEQLALKSILTASGSGEPWERKQLVQSSLQELVKIYSKAGRHADVLELLDKSPWWGKAELTSKQDGVLIITAAEALHAVGRDADAVPLARTCVLEDPERDPGYELLLKAWKPEEMIPWLDELYRRDRYEERPLIWKASAQLKMGKLDEAESTARQALKVDPTDGESASGDRVRAYAVLGDILDAKGKKDDANFFRNVVKSVRIAEKGDEFTRADMIKRSLALYEEAMGLFADAYCVQWRLAERYFATGEIEKANEHYRIAFERLPEQFGQVASFCFGCEGVFRQEHSRSIAEEVLLRLEKQGNPRPQLYYLLAQLRESQERSNDAWAYLKKAVAADPDYLDAWKQLDSMSGQVLVSQQEYDSIALRILELDPLSRHSGGSGIDGISDMAGAWKAMEKASTLAGKDEPAKYPLAASKAELEKNKSAGSEIEMMQIREAYMYESLRRESHEPGAAFARTPAFSKLSSLLGESETVSYDIF